MSDINIFSGYKGLLFKYDEELRFLVSDDNYYFPTINIKYPKRKGDFVESDLFPIKDAKDILTIDRVFNNDEIYYIEMDDARDILRNIGRFVVEMKQNLNGCILVTEDFLDNMEYSADDARIFNYARVVGENAQILHNINESQKSTE